MHTAAVDHSTSSDPHRSSLIREGEDGSLELVLPPSGIGGSSCQLVFLGVVGVLAVGFAVLSATSPEGPLWAGVALGAGMALLVGYVYWHALWVLPRRSLRWRFDGKGLTVHDGVYGSRVRHRWPLETLRGVVPDERMPNALGTRLNVRLQSTTRREVVWPADSTAERDELLARIERWLATHRPAADDVPARAYDEGNTVGALRMDESATRLHVTFPPDMPRSYRMALVVLVVFYSVVLLALGSSVVGTLTHHGLHPELINLTFLLLVVSALLLPMIWRITWALYAVESLEVDGRTGTWRRRLCPGIQRQVRFDVYDMAHVEVAADHAVRITLRDRSPLRLPSATEAEATALYAALKRRLEREPDSPPV